jgi:putative oxidoreductase
MSLIVLIGRILFCVLFLTSAIGHLTQTAAMAGYAGSKRVPQPKIMVIITGIMLAFGGLSILLGVWADLGALVLAAFLIPTAVIMHGFWRDTGEARMMEQVQFNKDLALGGACLMLFAFFREVGDSLGYTITGPLF